MATSRRLLMLFSWFSLCLHRSGDRRHLCSWLLERYPTLRLCCSHLPSEPGDLPTHLADTGLLPSRAGMNNAALSWPGNDWWHACSQTPTGSVCLRMMLLGLNSLHGKAHCFSLFFKVCLTFSQDIGQAIFFFFCESKILFFSKKQDQFLS